MIKRCNYSYLVVIMAHTKKTLKFVCKRESKFVEFGSLLFYLTVRIFIYYEI